MALRSNRLSRGLLTAAIAAGFGALLLALSGQTQTAAAGQKSPARVIEFTADGKLKRPPTGYRKWISIGTPLALHEGEPQEFHAVFMEPEDFAHYEKTGAFRDGTVIVKEAVGVGSTTSSAGKGYFMGEFTGLQVSIKDSKRFKDEPGNWAYFDFGNKYPLRAEASRKPTASCNKCHQDNARTDWVFSQYYPVLRAAPAHHTEKGQVKVTTLSQRDIIEKLDGKAAGTTVQEVTFEPGQKDSPHRHVGPVFGYVLKREYEHALDDEPGKTYKAGDTFYEPSGSVHRVARNPSYQTRTRLLAVVLHPRDAKEVTVPEKRKK